MQMIGRALLALGLACTMAAGAAIAQQDMNDPAMKACERLSGANKERCINQVREDMTSENPAVVNQPAEQNGGMQSTPEERTNGMSGGGMQSPSGGESNSGSSGSEEHNGGESR